jgi:hypothetical protein
MNEAEFHEKVLEIVDAIHATGVRVVDVHSGDPKSGECGFHVYFVVSEKDDPSTGLTVDGGK